MIFVRLKKLRNAVCMIMVLVYVVALPALAVAQEVAQGIFIPVIINLYPNSGVTEEEGREFVKEASKALKQASFRMVVVKVQDIQAGQGGDDGSGGGTAGDGDLTTAEGDKAIKFGEQEIQNTKNQKGIKISFVRTPWVDDPNTLEDESKAKGWSYHRKPVIILRKSTQAEANKYGRSIAEDTGETIAHEFGHIKTIEGDYPIDPANPWKMDSDATGDKFKEEEIKEMKKSRLKHGKCSVQFRRYYPAIKLEQQFGTKTDQRSDQGGAISPIYDLDLVYLTSVSDDGSIDAQVTVAEVLPDNENINARYAVGFDIDNNLITGVLYAGYQGIDRIVYVNASGNIGLGTFAITGEVEDTHLGTTSPLPVLPVSETEHKFLDFLGIHIPAATSFLFKVPKTMLDFSAIDVPAVATTGIGNSIYDTTSFVFDLQRWLKDPTLTTFGTGIPAPGKNYQFAIAGLKPYDTFNLYVDDRLVLSDTFDASGGYSGEFVFPSDLPNNQMYFLTAQDSTGEFAYTITCPQPLPPGSNTYWLALLGFLAMAAGFVVMRKARFLRV